MSTIHIASPAVFPRHLASLHDARTAIQNDIGQAQQALTRRVQSAQLAVDAASELVDDLRRAYDEPYEDNYGQTSSLQDDLEQAQVRLAAAQDRLDRTESAAEQAKAELARTFDSYIRHHFQAITTIEAQDLNLRAFTAIQLSGGGSESALPSFASSQTGQRSNPPAPPLTPPAQTLQKRLPLLPRGLAWVALTDLDMHSIPADMTFNHAPRADMTQMMETFMTGLVPMLQADPNLTRDGLAAMDTIMGIGVNGLVSPRSLAFAWDCMIGGNDLIALSRGSNGRYGWSSGRHRSLVAQSLGWTHVPARILGTTAP